MKMEFVSPWIHTTDMCNLRCHYCYVRGAAVMPSKVYLALYKLLLKVDTNDIHLRFAGGEPLLVFDIWNTFAKTMLKHHNARVEVLTNLVDVPKKFWKFAEHERVSVSVSVDNGREVKVLDKDIANKLARLRDPWIMTTITEENIDNLDVLAAFIGMNKYGWCLTTDYFEVSVPKWEILSVKILEVLEILKQFNYDFTKISFNNASVKAGFSGCRIGKEMFAVGCDGSIYKCQTLINQSGKIGSVFDGYKISDACIRKSCKSCSVYGLCKGWCPLYYKTPNPICNVIKLFLNKVVKEVQNAE
jgi:radical SAM protein with 4Fe4S-binding SPASM domain